MFRAHWWAAVATVARLVGDLEIAEDAVQDACAAALTQWPAARHPSNTWSSCRVLDKRGIRAADDMVVMPLQCGTQWDGLGHVFYENYMWNGYDCREVTTAGAQKCGIEKTKNKMVGRGVLLDVARHKGVDSLDDGYGITCKDLDDTAKKQKSRSSAATT